MHTAAHRVPAIWQWLSFGTSIKMWFIQTTSAMPFHNSPSERIHEEVHFWSCAYVSCESPVLQLEINNVFPFPSQWGYSLSHFASHSFAFVALLCSLFLWWSFQCKSLTAHSELGPSCNNQKSLPELWTQEEILLLVVIPTAAPGYEAVPGPTAGSCSVCTHDLAFPARLLQHQTD